MSTTLTTPGTLRRAQQIIADGLPIGPRMYPCVCREGLHAHAGKAHTGACKASGCKRYRADRAWRLAYGSEPTTGQAAAGVAFLREQTAAFRKLPTPQTPKGGKPAAPRAADQRALATFCQALLGSNRFLYVD